MNLLPTLKEAVNPYRERVHQFPGRIYCGTSEQEDVNLLRLKLASASARFCEFGSGSGIHLIQLAERYPAAACVGYELRYKRAVRTIEKALAARVSNVYVMRQCGLEFASLFEKQTLDGLFVNFPDPWEKRRFRKHRVLNTSLLNQVWPCLTEDGFLSVKTDHREYFEEFYAFACAHPGYDIAEYSDNLHRSELTARFMTTEFENLFLSKRLPIYYLKLHKLSYGPGEY